MSDADRAVPDPAPVRRADAARNRERIIAAAQQAHAEAGGQVSMAEIARRSGVGSATLYRNFATRRELLEALYVDEVDALCAAVRTVEGPRAADRLLAWLRRFVDYLLSKRHVAGELLEAGGDRSVFNASRARVVAAATPLLVDAQREGEITPELSLDQILDLLAATARISADLDYVEPMITTVLAGLRPPQRG